MNERDIGALIVGILLGCLSAYLTPPWGIFAPGMFILGGLLFTLVVCLIAGRQIALLGFVPNVVTSLCLTIYILLFSPAAKRGEWLDITFVVLIMFGLGGFLSLLVSVPVFFLRRRFDEEEETLHVFSRDA